MSVQLSDDLFWIEECYDLGDDHKHVSVYLIYDGDTAILIDTGSHYHRDAIENDLESIVGAQPLDALTLSHSDYPHSGNVRKFAAANAETDLIASSGAPAKQGLPEATKCDIGGNITISGYEFGFIDPPLADRSHTTWIYNHDSASVFG